MSTALIGLGILSLAAWIYLIAFRHGFWRADQRLPDNLPEPGTWPAVVAVVPARDEADVVEHAAAGLVGQDYPGPFAVVLVDDSSTDGTADVAARGADRAGRPDRLTVTGGTPLPDGWTGKMWAVAQGVDEAARRMPDARYIWLTDADVQHPPDKLRALVAMAEHRGLDLVSLMVRLHCRAYWERLLIPAFVFFFQMLYPFRAVNEPNDPTAGAAGGCMLVRRAALQRAGGIEPIRDRLIDDCALAAQIKARGPIWLGLARGSHSLRPYRGLGDIWRMIARTAYTQLDHSVVKLAGTVAGMSVIYIVPVAALAVGLFAGTPVPAALGGAALGLMYLAYGPTWRLYRPIGFAFFALPAAALLYTLKTLDSARRHWLGAGGGWKGRTYDRGGPRDGNPLGSDGTAG